MSPVVLAVTIVVYIDSFYGVLLDTASKCLTSVAFQARTLTALLPHSRRCCRLHLEALPRQVATMEEQQGIYEALQIIPGC